MLMFSSVRFREVGRILDGWTKNREMEIQQANNTLSTGHKERRELDEQRSGAKRSG
jgi:hypothetical protein